MRSDSFTTGPLTPGGWRIEMRRLVDAAVVEPVRFEWHVDHEAHARKLIGLDLEGRRCYVRHLHTVVREGFDIDELPWSEPCSAERRIAWRLQDGCWLLQVDRVERLDSCRPRIARALPRVLPERELGM